MSSRTSGRARDVDEALFDQLTGTTTVTREANATVVRAELQDKENELRDTLSAQREA